jgi:hypothetical protein
MTGRPGWRTNAPQVGTSPTLSLSINREIRYSRREMNSLISLMAREQILVVRWETLTHCTMVPGVPVELSIVLAILYVLHPFWSFLTLTFSQIVALNSCVSSTVEATAV